MGPELDGARSQLARPAPSLVNAWRHLLFLFALCLTATLADAAPGEPDPALELSGVALVRALREGGYVIYFRHADTGPASPEPGTVDLQRCETQRNLNERGVAEARKQSTIVASLGIPAGTVYASRYCRAMWPHRPGFIRTPREGYSGSARA